MRHAALVALLVLSLAVPGSAAAPVALPYSMTLTGSYFSGTTPSGGIGGTLGGVSVSGAYGNGTWTLSAFGRTFATGTYECVHICTFTGSMLAGRAVNYEFTSQVPTWDARIIATTGGVSGAFWTQSAWVSAVSAWASANGLPASLRTKIVVDAKTGM